MRTDADFSSNWRELFEAIKYPDYHTSLSYWVRKRRQAKAVLFWSLLLCVCLGTVYYVASDWVIYIIPSLKFPTVLVMRQRCFAALTARESEARVCGLVLPLVEFGIPASEVMNHDPDFAAFCDHSGNFYAWPRLDLLHSSPVSSTMETFEQCACPSGKSFDCRRMRYQHTTIVHLDEKRQLHTVLVADQMLSFCFQHLAEVHDTLFQCYQNTNCCGT